jgi:hypothetical protein
MASTTIPNGTSGRAARMAAMIPTNAPAIRSR